MEFYNGLTPLSTDTSAPFSFTWTGVGAGSYQLRAIAFDADGESSLPAIVNVTVEMAPQRPAATIHVTFTASVDHAIVTSYLLEVFPSTANPATATAMASSDLGKPTPSGTNEIITDRTTFLNDLAPGNYLVTVASVAPEANHEAPRLASRGNVGLRGTCTMFPLDSAQSAAGRAATDRRVRVRARSCAAAE